MNTTIWEEAQLLYDRTSHTLESDIVAYAKHGCVFASDAYLILARRIGEGWYIQAAIGAGALPKFAELMPYYLPYIGWRRERKHNQECVWHRTEQVLRTIKSYARRNTSPSQATSATHEG